MLLFILYSRGGSVVNTKNNANLFNELREEIIPVSGTLDAVVHFLREEYGLSEEDSAKAALLLLIAQEAGEGRREFSALARYDKSNIDAFFDESQRAKGLIGSLRVSINLTEAKIQIAQAIPATIFKWKITESDVYEGLSDALATLISILLNNTKVINADHTCICLSAWKIASCKEGLSKTFTVDELIAAHKNYLCEGKCPFSSKFSLCVRGLSIWKCQKLEYDGTCLLKDKEIEPMLTQMMSLHIIDRTYNLDIKEYKFL